MQNSTAILDSKDGRILMSVDSYTLDAILEACADKYGQRLEELIAAIHSYQAYKSAQTLVADYERPERIAAVKETFLGKKAK